MKSSDTQQQQSHSRAAADATTQLKEGNGETLEFVDNRPEAQAQRRLAEAMNNSPRHAATQRAADIMQRAENKTGMPDNLKSGIESLSGFDMSDVRVHRNSDKPAQLNAHAFARHQLQNRAAGIGFHRVSRFKPVGIGHAHNFTTTGSD